MFDFSVIIDVGVVALRILMPLYAIFIVYQLYAAMRRRRRPEKPLVTLMNTRTFEKIPVLFWENSIGRKRSNDIVVNDAGVSKVHAVLMRRDEGWLINDTESVHGTFVASAIPSSSSSAATSMTRRSSRSGSSRIPATSQPSSRGS